MRKDVAEILRKIFDAADLHAAEQLLAATVKKYEKSAPKLATWLEANIPEGLAVLKLPEAHRKRLRTTNMLERQNREIKRRTRVATLFPNEASLLRLVSAVLSEISEDWETGKTYLPISSLTLIMTIILMCYRGSLTYSNFLPIYIVWICNLKL